MTRTKAELQEKILDAMVAIEKLDASIRGAESVLRELRAARTIGATTLRRLRKLYVGRP